MERFSLKEDITITLKIKKSTFICSLLPVSSIFEAQNRLSDLQLYYNNANHNCYCYRVITDSGTYEKFNDDGEPTSTAGKPILSSLVSNDLYNVLAVVSRYFGGIKLGTGGLMRAYSEATLEAIRQSQLAKLEEVFFYVLATNLSQLKAVKNFLNKEMAVIDTIKYDLTVTINFNVLTEDTILKLRAVFYKDITIEFIEKKLCVR